MDKVVNALQIDVDKVRRDIYIEFKKPTRELTPIEIMDMPPSEIPPVLKSSNPRFPIGNATVKPAITYPPSSTLPKEVQFTSLRIEGLNLPTPTTQQQESKFFFSYFRTWNINYILIDLTAADIPTLAKINKESEPERRSHRNIAKPATYDEDTMDLIESNAIQMSPRREESDDVQVVSVVVDEPKNLPEKGTLQRPQLIIGEAYYAMKSSPLGPWGKCKLIEIVHKNVSTFVW